MQNPDWIKIKEVFNQTINLPADEREKILAEYDESIRKEVRELIDSHENADAFINNPIAVNLGFDKDTNVGTTIDNYKILEIVGAGGMGTVYLAERTDLGQKVALKLIKRGMDTREVLKRFKLERQILSRLNHQNIARLLDAGSTEDGLPYFVMEYIEGETIIKFCNNHDFDINERLELFQKVCSAISYAHSNLIVHRDIKPSNIIVTNDGTPKLLDFGIAKLLDNESENTATQARIFTPEYASPEQIKGLPITTATDVYSLGVVLYQLLSGVRPFTSESRNYAEIANLVLTVEPVKPSLVVSGQWSVVRNTSEIKDETQNEATKFRNPQSAIRNLKGDLDNIVLKSLRKEPERRYQSVSDFSEDIKRHLQGLPVTATADSTRYRFTKFVQRHKRGVAIGSIVGLLILAISGVAIWQAVVANRERSKAEQRFNDVRKLANTVLFDYHDGIEKLVGSTPIREKMVKDSLEYLDKLTMDAETDTDLQSEIATAYQKVGDVQGAPFKANLGDYAGALKSYQNALKLRQELFNRNSGDEKLKLELAKDYKMVGHVSQLTGNTQGAIENYNKSLAIFNSMPEKTMDAQRAFALLYVRFGLLENGDLSEATENHRKGLAILTDLANRFPDNKELKVDIARSNLYHGNTLLKAGEMKPAMENYRTALSIFESLVTANDAESQRDIIVAKGRISNLLQKTGKFQEALSIEMELLKKDEEFLAKDPQNANAKRDLHIDYYKIAVLKSELKDLKGAIEDQTKAVKIAESLVSLNPMSSEATADLGVAYYHLAEFNEMGGKLSEALELYEKTLALEKKASETDPANAELISNIAEDYLTISNLYMKLGKSELAFVGYQKSLELANQLVATNPEEIDNQTSLADANEKLGAFYAFEAKNKPDKWQIAKDNFQKSLDIWEKLKQMDKLQDDELSKIEELKTEISKCDTKIPK
jgi:eukaryotic-like serine/threonine-protein kinase